MQIPMCLRARVCVCVCTLDVSLLVEVLFETDAIWMSALCWAQAMPHVIDHPATVTISHSDYVIPAALPLKLADIMQPRAWERSFSFWKQLGLR